MANLRRINLIPAEAPRGPLRGLLRGFGRLDYSLRRAIAIGAGAALLLLAVPVFSLSYCRARCGMAKGAKALRKSKLKKAQAQAFELQKKKADILKDQALRKERLGYLLSTSAEGRDYSRLLLCLSQVAPADLWINRFAINEKEIIISGSTLSSTLITEFMDKLDKSTVFLDCSFISTERQESEGRVFYSFQISAQPYWVR
jgi:Tfp pilus assembly protein PilN